MCIDGGRIVIKAEYEDALPFVDGLAPARTDGQWGYIDRTGKPVIRGAV